MNLVRLAIVIVPALLGGCASTHSLDSDSFNGGGKVLATTRYQSRVLAFYTRGDRRAGPVGAVAAAFAVTPGIGLLEAGIAGGIAGGVSATRAKERKERLGFDPDKFGSKYKIIDPRIEIERTLAKAVAHQYHFDYIGDSKAIVTAKMNTDDVSAWNYRYPYVLDFRTK